MQATRLFMAVRPGITLQGNKEEEMREMAKGADAFTGGSIKSSPITGKITDSAPGLHYCQVFHRCG